MSMFNVIVMVAQNEKDVERARNLINNRCPMDFSTVLVNEETKEVLMFRLKDDKWGQYTWRIWERVIDKWVVHQDLVDLGFYCDKEQQKEWGAVYELTKVPQVAVIPSYNDRDAPLVVAHRGILYGMIKEALEEKRYEVMPYTVSFIVPLLEMTDPSKQIEDWWHDVSIMLQKPLECYREDEYITRLFDSEDDVVEINCDDGRYHVRPDCDSEELCKRTEELIAGVGGIPARKVDWSQAVATYSD